ncbi:MAG: methionine adenosyltransferase, partial [Clostridiales bacterium]|nr:methionine adenosyltransferase [Clostridiales bacterium]
ETRVALETCATTGLVLLMGEVTTNAYVDMESVARKVILDIGYDHSKLMFDGNSCAVLTSVHEQSGDIAQGVNNALESRNALREENIENGAGDQGMMFGFACDETPEYMPLALSLAHQLVHQMTKLRKNGTLPWMRPDGKAQVTLTYEDFTPLHIDAIVISTQHSESVDHSTIEKAIKQLVIDAIVPAHLLDERTAIYVNPTGRFVLGGPAGDSGLTGRKIIVDTYGGYARHGGGAFSGKAPTKVDRSAAYACRYVAKNLVAAGLCKRCEVAVSYAIGVAKPVSFMVDTKGTGVLPDEQLSTMVLSLFDLRPSAIIEKFQLRRPIYQQTAAYGHFGREDLSLPWEALDAVSPLKDAYQAYTK